MDWNQKRETAIEDMAFNLLKVDSNPNVSEARIRKAILLCCDSFHELYGDPINGVVPMIEVILDRLTSRCAREFRPVVAVRNPDENKYKGIFSDFGYKSF